MWIVAKGVDPGFRLFHAHKNLPTWAVLAKLAQDMIEHFLAKIIVIAKFPVLAAKCFRLSHQAIHSKAFAHDVLLLRLKTKGAHREIGDLVRGELLGDLFDHF